MEMNVEGRRGRLKTEEKVVGRDMRTAGVSVDDVGDRVKWRFRTQATKAGKEAREKKKK